MISVLKAMETAKQSINVSLSRGRVILYFFLCLYIFHWSFTLTVTNFQNMGLHSTCHTVIHDWRSCRVSRRISRRNSAYGPFPLCLVNFFIYMKKKRKLQNTHYNTLNYLTKLQRRYNGSKRLRLSHEFTFKKKLERKR